MSTEKPTNPKDLIGCNKLPLHLWPESATAYGCLALLDGASKYGRSNWRDKGVKASVYVDALRRHVNRWFEGEQVDEDSGLHPLCHALACLAILVDAITTGNLVDDRQYEGDGYLRLVGELTPHVARLREKHRDKTPIHYTRETAIDVKVTILDKQWEKLHDARMERYREADTSASMTPDWDHISRGIL